MKLELNLLKFHSFYYDKRYNNLWLKNKVKEIETKLIKKYFYGKIDFLLSKKDFAIQDLKFFGNFHSFGKNEKNMLFIIIEKCHPNLYNDIFNILSEDKKIDDIEILQFRITGRSRCVALINNEIMYPLLFDLKHCFYEYSKREFDNNKKQEKEEWDLKEKQEEIKRYLLNKF